MKQFVPVRSRLWVLPLKKHLVNRFTRCFLGYQRVANFWRLSTLEFDVIVSQGDVIWLKVDILVGVADAIYLVTNELSMMTWHE